MRRRYPDQQDEKQYTDYGPLLATAETIYPGKRTEKCDGLGLLDGEIEGDGCGYQGEEGIEICPRSVTNGVARGKPTCSKECGQP